jgi:crossover junction endodeoxyribonuclease RusA
MVVSRLSGARPLEGRLSFTALLYPKDRRRRDVDNVLKSLLDSLAHAGTMHDDSQIKVLHVVMNEPDGEARVEVRMEELE